MPCYPETQPWTTLRRAARQRAALWRAARFGASVLAVAVIIAACFWYLAVCGLVFLV